MNYLQLLAVITMSAVTLSSMSCTTTYYKQENSETTIGIVIVGSKLLNRYKSKSHPLVVDIYQLENLDQIRLLNKRVGFNELKQVFDTKMNPLSYNSIILLPGSAKKLKLVAQGSCAYLAILAGFYEAETREDLLAVYPITKYKRGIFKLEFGDAIEPEIYIKLGERKII